MSEKVSLIIELSSEERDLIEAQAHARGFDLVSNYLRALAASDIEAELSDEQILGNLAAGLKEALRGETYPVETLWEKLDDE